MNIIEILTKEFFYNELFKTLLLIIISCSLSLLKLNAISYLTANIIKSIQLNNIENVYNYYKYFVIVSIIYVILYIIYSFLQNNLLIKMKLWIKNELLENIMKNNNENLSDQNFTKLNIPIQRIATLLYFLYNNFISTLIPNLSILLVVFLYFTYNNFKFGSIFLILNIIIISFSYHTINTMIPYQINCEDNIYITESTITEILNNFNKIIYRGYIKKESDDLKKVTNDVLNIHYDYYNKLNNYNIT